MSRYFLPPHVHVCAGADTAVLLDLKRDQYIGLGTAQVAALRKVVHGWPAAQNHEVNVEESSSVGATLVAKGLLTQDQHIGKPASQLELEIASLPLRSEPGEAVTIHLSDLATLALAYVRIRLALRFRSLESIVMRVERRKRSRSKPIDHATLKQRLFAFHQLRPFFYTSRKQCLMDSLVLLDYLASYELYPTLVIGVRLSPFAAHAWVQQDSYALNNSPTYVRRFTPILAV